MNATMHITHHGANRLQNRAIPEKVVNWLLGFGNSVYQPGNTQIVHFTNRGRKKLIPLLSSSDRQLFEKKSHAYLVLSHDSTMITAGYRKKRLPRY